MTNKPKIVAVSVAGLMMIAGFEGMCTDAYKYVVGIPTICYGHTQRQLKWECPRPKSNVGSFSKKMWQVLKKE